MSKFSDEYRAGAVVMMQSEGYPSNAYALGKVHTYLRQKAPYPSKPTLMNWFNGVSNPPPLSNLNEKKGDMADALQSLTWRLIDHANKDETISDMSGQQTITSIGILVDKIRLLMGLPTQIISILPEFVSTMEQMGEDPETILRRMIERAQQRTEIKRP